MKPIFFAGYAVGLAGALLLAGCAGDSAAPVQPAPTFSDQVLAAASVASQIDALPGTAFLQMPDSGAATYAGVSALSVTAGSGAEFALLGQADVTVDFQSGAVSGSLSRFQGGVISAGGLLPTSVADFAGAIQITGGQVGVVRANLFDGTFAGTLTGAGDTIATSGTVLGAFKGTPIKAIAGISDSSVTTVNGVAAVDATLEFWGK